MFWISSSQTHNPHQALGPFHLVSTPMRSRRDSFPTPTEILVKQVNFWMQMDESRVILGGHFQTFILNLWFRKGWYDLIFHCSCKANILYQIKIEQKCLKNQRHVLCTRNGQKCLAIFASWKSLSQHLSGLDRVRSVSEHRPENLSHPSKSIQWHEKQFALLNQSQAKCIFVVAFFRPCCKTLFRSFVIFCLW